MRYLESLTTNAIVEVNSITIVGVFVGAELNTRVNLSLLHLVDGRRKSSCKDCRRGEESQSDGLGEHVWIWVGKRMINLKFCDGLLQSDECS